MAKTVADGMWEMLVAAGVRRCYGIVGDALNPVIDALRRNGSVDFVHVRHEEYGAFAAVADARPTVTTGPHVPRAPAQQATQPRCLTPSGPATSFTPRRDHRSPGRSTHPFSTCWHCWSPHWPGSASSTLYSWPPANASTT
jgi:hypothetical protein